MRLAGAPHRTAPVAPPCSRRTRRRAGIACAARQREAAAPPGVPGGAAAAAAAAAVTLAACCTSPAAVAAVEAAVGPVDPAAFVPGPPGWQVTFAAAVSTVPFVIGAYEFGKRILIQRRCQVCAGSGLVTRGRFQRKCPECGGFFPWVSWQMFLSANARPGNGGPLLQPRGQSSVFYSVPPPPGEEQRQQPGSGGGFQGEPDARGGGGDGDGDGDEP
ncbi:hypothetical protein HT031_000357 [Scenedesmus sp. PABB004]|nr:hypothetical protein HT031_000357 [Scenedesmus sp. PABB004]